MSCRRSAAFLAVATTNLLKLQACQLACMRSLLLLCSAEYIRSRSRLYGLASLARTVAQATQSCSIMLVGTVVIMDREGKH